MELEFQCSECGKSSEFEFESEDVQIACASCGKKYSAIHDLLDPDGKLQKCGICGCRDLYIQKDFNRKVGIAIVVLGAVLAPFTKMISLFVCALIDLILYKALPLISICYKCSCIYRDFPSNPDHLPFNLGINDRYRAAER